MKLEIRKFNIKEIKDDSVIVMIGKRGTGKSTLIKDLMYHMQHIPAGIVISGSESVNEFYQNFVPKMLIYDCYTPETVKNFVDRQMRINKQMKQEQKLYGKSDINPKAFIVMDDMMFDKRWINDNNVRFLVCNGRHCHSLFVLSLQFPLGIPPMMRTNVDYIFILRENILSNRKRIFEQYAGMFDSYETFSQVLDQCTENYECLVINTKTLSNKITDQVFWYKAEHRPKFKLCSSEFWDIQAMDEERKMALEYKQNAFGEDDDPDYNPKDIRAKKKSATTINVKKAHF